MREEKKKVEGYYFIANYGKASKNGDTTKRAIKKLLLFLFCTLVFCFILFLVPWFFALGLEFQTLGLLILDPTHGKIWA